jgi:hypothetical protein
MKPISLAVTFMVLSTSVREFTALRRFRGRGDTDDGNG